METDDLELPNDSSEEEENGENGENGENEEESEGEGEEEDEEDLENENENNDEDDEDDEERVSSGKVEEEQASLQPGAADCSSYNIVPYVAALHATSVNALVSTPCSRWLFTGGSDGYIRRFDLFASVAGKSLLTMAQRHPFVDTVTKGGVLMSCWENEDRPLGATSSSTALESPHESKMSPVYALAVHSQAVWLLSGLDSGTINLQTVRIEQGRIIATLSRHKSAVSVLTLDADETAVLSGGWDRDVFDWDLNLGIAKRSFDGHTGQLAVISARPSSHLPITTSPADSDLDSLFGDDNDGPKNGEYKPKEIGQKGESKDAFMTACIDGTIRIWDKRQAELASKIPVTRGVPPWCMSACWSENGEEIFVGRRNSCIEQFSLRNFSSPSRTLKLPAGSLAVSSVQTLPNGRHILAASYDTIRLYDVEASNKSVPFYIVPGHRTGTVSTMLVDPTCRFVITAGGNRGWEGNTTDVVLISEIGVVP